MVKFSVPGKPMGKQRPRVLRRGISYTPKETVSYENLIKLCYMENPAKRLFDGPVNMRIVAYYPIPKSTSKKQAERMKACLIRPTKKPDCDNITKIICDALNNVAYKDDSQIVGCEVQKFYGDEPRIEVEIWEWEAKLNEKGA